MGIINNYLSYRKHKPEYKPWKEKRQIQEQKRLEYIQSNNIPETQKQEDIKKAKAVLNAVDIMDEYSQSRAEDMEMVTRQFTNMLSQPVLYGSIGIGALLNLIKPIRPFAIKIAKLFKKQEAWPLVFPAIAGIIGALTVMPLFSAWGAKKELQASREGRLEAINTDLASVKQFAVLNDEQLKQRDEIAKNIKIPKKEQKKDFKATKGLGIMQSLSIIKNGDKKYQEYIKEVEEKTEADKENFDTVRLSQEDTLNAKKDKQLIQNIVEKIDIASQDYAENIELATGVMSAVSFGSGGLAAVGINKLLKLCKVKKSKTIATVAGFTLALLGAFYAAKVQKQGSRVARFKVKEELMQNPEQLIYVDDEKVKNNNLKGEIKENKLNFFKFIPQVFKDNKDYNEYLKTKAIERKQRSKAQEEIQLTEAQEKRAHQLQQNVFKMFNKLDEKSQAFSESTEAIGETVQAYISLLPIIITGIGSYKIAGSLAKTGKVNKKSIAAIILSFIPTILLNILITKDQKNASRTADMMAVREMDDYRNFADYPDLNNKNGTKDETNTHLPAFPQNTTPPWKK